VKEEEESDDGKEGEMLREEMRVVMSERVSLMEERASEMMWRMEGGLMGRDERLEEMEKRNEERFNHQNISMNERLGRMERSQNERLDQVEMMLQQILNQLQK